MVAAARRAEADEAIDILGHERNIARAALYRVERGHFGKAEILVDDIQLRQQTARAVGRRHRRITVSPESNLRRRTGRCARHNGLHPGADSRGLFIRQRADVAARNRDFGNDIGSRIFIFTIIIAMRLNDGCKDLILRFFTNDKTRFIA